MIKLFDFLKPLDIFIFQQLDILKTNIYYQQLTDRIASLNNSAQKVVYQIISFSIIFFPILMAFLLFFANCSLRGELNEKHLIKENIDLFLKNKNTLTSYSVFISTQEIKTLEELTDRVNRTLNSLKISQNSASVSNFISEESLSGISQASADLNFNGFSIEDFWAFANAMITEKIYIDNLNIIRNITNQTIQGDLHLKIFNKSVQYEN